MECLSLCHHHHIAESVVYSGTRDHNSDPDRGKETKASLVLPSLELKLSCRPQSHSWFICSYSLLLLFLFIVIFCTICIYPYEVFLYILFLCINNPDGMVHAQPVCIVSLFAFRIIHTFYTLHLTMLLYYSKTKKRSEIMKMES